MKEETGVDAEFAAFVGFREKHGYTWGRDDFYYYAYLKPTSTAISHDTEEVERCQWMDFEVCVLGGGGGGGGGGVGERKGDYWR